MSYLCFCVQYEWSVTSNTSCNVAFTQTGHKYTNNWSLWTVLKLFTGWQMLWDVCYAISTLAVTGNHDLLLFVAHPQVQIRAITVIPQPGGGDGIPVWAIVVPIILGLIAIVVLGVILYMVNENFECVVCLMLTLLEIGVHPPIPPPIPPSIHSSILFIHPFCLPSCLSVYFTACLPVLNLSICLLMWLLLCQPNRWDSSRGSLSKERRSCRLRFLLTSKVARSRRMTQLQPEQSSFFFIPNHISFAIVTTFYVMYKSALLVSGAV